MGPGSDIGIYNNIAEYYEKNPDPMVQIVRKEKEQLDDDTEDIYD